MTQPDRNDKNLTRDEFTELVTTFKNEWETADGEGQAGHRSERALEVALSQLGIRVDGETPQLPSKTGSYRDVNGAAWHFANGAALVAGRQGPVPEDVAVQFAPFVALVTLDEARPIIAAEVTDWMRSAHLIGREPADVTRDHFGVSE